MRDVVLAQDQGPIDVDRGARRGLGVREETRLFFHERQQCIGLTAIIDLIDHPPHQRQRAVGIFTNVELERATQAHGIHIARPPVGDRFEVRDRGIDIAFGPGRVSLDEQALAIGRRRRRFGAREIVLCPRRVAGMYLQDRRDDVGHGGRVLIGGRHKCGTFGTVKTLIGLAVEQTIDRGNGLGLVG